MKKILLSQNKVALVDDEDFERINKYRWAAHKTPEGTFYAVRNPSNDYTEILMHRAILLAPKGIHVDHINHNGLDNRKRNLRFATNAQNMRNTRKFRTNTSGYKGVSALHLAHGIRWRAYIVINYRQHHLGNFATAKQAARAYDRAARKLYGKFGNLNFQSHNT